jgi:capsular polysaccharide transport system ATP-binding protein
LIHLIAVEQWSRDPNVPSEVILRPTTLSLPADRRLAVLGTRRSRNSHFLRLLAGIATPTRGRVLSAVRLSPIMKSNGLFHPYLNGLENIRQFARMLNLAPDRLAAAMDEFSGTGGALGGPAKEEDRLRRREAEMALLSLLPFGCYLIDEIAQFSEALARRHLGAVSSRGAGLIFTTTSSRLVRCYADCAIVLRDASVHPFSDVEEATAFHER